MRRPWLALVLLLSLGVNVGLLAAIAVGRTADDGPVAESPPLALPGAGRELPAGVAVEVPDDQRPVESPGHRFRRGPGGGRGPGEPPVGRLADHLGLEGEVRERFVARQRDFLAAYFENRRLRRELGDELRRELLTAQPDRARIEALLSRLAEVQEAGERATVEVILDSRQLLDDEQQRGYFLFLDRLREGRRPDGPDRGERRRRPPR